MRRAAAFLLSAVLIAELVLNTGFFDVYAKENGIPSEEAERQERAAGEDTEEASEKRLTEGVEESPATEETATEPEKPAEENGENPTTEETAAETETVSAPQAALYAASAVRGKRDVTFTLKIYGYNEAYPIPGNLKRAGVIWSENKNNPVIGTLEADGQQEDGYTLWRYLFQDLEEGTPYGVKMGDGEAGWMPGQIGEFAQNGTEFEKILYAVNLYDGSELKNILYCNSGGRISVPALKKEGCTFAGWVTADGGSEAFDFNNTAITQVTNIYASWTADTLPAANIVSGDGWVLAGDGTLTIESDVGMSNWTSQRVFYNKRVTSVEIQNDVTGIEKNAFVSCSNLTEITIPENVTSIGENAFGFCGLTEITIPETVTSIEAYAFNNCKGLASVVLPDNLTSIKKSMFQQCNSLTSITIPESVESIGDIAFYGCSSLTGITIPENVTSIGERAFFQCSGLTSITIPEKVASIGANAFNGCSELAEVIMNGETPPTLSGNQTFLYCGFYEKGAKGIHVPAGKAETYKTAWTDWVRYIADDATPAGEHKHNDVTFTAWTATDRLPTDAGNYYLTENVTLSETWNVPNGTTSLCLNGKTIRASGTGEYRVITINVSSTLKLYDCQNTGNITGGKEGGVRNKGTLYMYGGKISGNGRAAYGGGVRTEGTFQMYGGEISGNSAFYFGGGVYVGDGIFRMYGGKISGNTNDEGGGVYVYKGAFTVGGDAVISGNTYNRAENNVYLEGGQTIVIDSSNPLSGSASIGVRTKTAPTEGNPVSVTGHNKGDYSSYFTSDNLDYEIVNSGDVVKLEVKAQAHTHTLTLTPAKDATCTQAGNKAYYTCGCGKWFSDEKGTQEITDKNSVIIAPAHSYDTLAWGYQGAGGHAHKCRNCDAHDTVWAHTPGAAATDTMPQTCTACGYIITPALGHTCTLQPVEKKEPDCTTAGKETYYHCAGCGKDYENAAGTIPIADIDTWGNIAALGHDYGAWTVTQPATATASGKKERVCNRCAYKETADIPILGPVPGTSAPDDNQPDTFSDRSIGIVDKNVQADGNAPAMQIATPVEELADMLLTPEEKQRLASGTDIRIVLDVKDADSSISREDRAFVEAALNSPAAEGYSVGQYLDIGLFKVIGDSRSTILETNKKIAVVIAVPDGLKNMDGNTTRTFAVLRVHNGVAELLADLDNSSDTITIATDRFSTYAIVFKDTAGIGSDEAAVSDADKNKPSPVSQKDNEPKTGDTAPVELYATLAMIMGLGYLLLYFEKPGTGMTEERKKELVAGLVGWAKQGGKLRRLFALAVIFVLLVYYHGIAKKKCAEWKEAYGE